MITDEYFENLKKNNLVFTEHNMNPKRPFVSVDISTNCLRPLTPPDGPSYWSHLSGRYRDYEEQREYLASGCVDKELPPIRR